MRVLIFGASGMLGKDLLSAFAQNENEVIGLGSKDADLRDEQQVLSVIHKARPDWIILSAAYADVDGCEADRAKAFAINRDGAIRVARAAAENRSGLAFISSDYVFNGEKRDPYETSDPLDPINVYGRSKAEAETALREITPDCCIIRTSWLFAVGGKCFPETMLKLASTQPELRVVDDQRGSPTYTPDLAKAIAELTQKRASGIVHVTNSGSCSWFEFAQAILADRSPQTKVVPVTTAEFPRPAKRPANSVLSGRSLHALGIELPEWRDALQRFFRQHGD
jgi:dTDP-4-dehydrorhamnose reductase